jgi:hypothetical protein
MHNNRIAKGCSVVESFIAPENSSEFIPGAWVVGVHVPDPELWLSIKNGEINGFSMEALVKRFDRTVDLELPPIVEGLTSKSEDHQHHFYVTYDTRGVFKGGTTDVVDGHSHKILAGTHTEAVNGHSHRFSSVDNVRVLVEGGQ